MRSGYIRGTGIIVFLTLLYPVAWACSEGANVISPTSEMVWYGILDLLLGPFFLFFFVFGIRNIEYEAFGLRSWKYSDTAAVAVIAGTTSATVGPAVAAKAGTAPGTATAAAPNMTHASSRATSPTVPASVSTAPGTSVETAAGAPTATTV